MNKVEFPNLNGLRFLAAFGVVVHHIEQIKMFYGFQNCYRSCTAVSFLGWQGVTLFFVLSGFLITYLLLQEVRFFGRVDIVKFYIRRSLRIWPLYFVIVLLSFAVLPAFSFEVPKYGSVWSKEWGMPLLLYLVFSPQVSEVWLWQVPFAGVLWSVGLEEWFYLIWPWIVKQAKRWALLYLLGIVIVLPVARMLVQDPKMHIFLNRARFDCMAVGGLLAMLLTAREKPFARSVLAVLYRVEVQVLVYVMLTLLITKGINWSSFGVLVYGLLYGVAILNLAANPRTIVQLENRPLRWLGSISYGTYCYNWITTVAAVKMVLFFWPGQHPDSIALNVLVYVLSILLVIVVAGISYEVFERKFLLLKQHSFTRLPNMSVETGKETDSPSTRLTGGGVTT